MVCNRDLENAHILTKMCRNLETFQGRYHFQVCNLFVEQTISWYFMSSQRIITSVCYTVIFIFQILPNNY